MTNCQHTNLTCLNRYDYIRKYRCDKCCKVMMCACEEEFARTFLPHQIAQVTDESTRIRVPVTGGFVNGLCNICRGVPEEAFPRAATYGNSSKIRRYYWREIFFETTRRYDVWLKANGEADSLIAILESDMRNAIEKQVVEELKKSHQSKPKYTYAKEESQEELVRKHKIDTVNLHATYAKSDGNAATIIEDGKSYTPEQFAAKHYEQEGFEVLQSESRPFHCLFGVMLWPLLQDPDDSGLQLRMFDERNAFDQATEGEVVQLLTPHDFGTAAYASRRTHAIEEYFSELYDSRDDLIWQFDYLLDDSWPWRQYLWVHREEDAALARKVLSVLPPERTLEVLRYLIEDYWDRYCGWPDLLVHNSDRFLFAEVKSSRDKLSDDQKRWIRGNSLQLHFPFQLVKIHRSSTTAGPPSIPS